MKKTRIHPTAIIDPKAEIDSSCEIGPYCIVGPKVKMGPGNRLLSHVVIENRTTLGSNNIVYPFATLGADPADLKYKGEDTELIIGDDNKIRESVSLHIGTEFGGGYTRIGNGNLIMAYVHFGHDCIVGNHTIIANSCQIAGHVTIEDHASIGGLTGVSQFVRIGAYAYIGGCSGVSKDVVPFCIGLGPVNAFEVKGINIVGLKRRGFASESITALMEAHKIFFRENWEKIVALQKIEEKYSLVPEVRAFIDFIKNSQSGVSR